MNVSFVDLKAQHQTIAEEVTQGISRVLENTAFILGEDVRLFEQEFADYCGARFGVGMDNGTSALELALRAYGIGEGDEVLVPDFVAYLVEYDRLQVLSSGDA